jgi:chromosome segregation ATPase
MPAVPPNDKAITDLQRQLVLAQVRILELEDIRDDAGTKIAELDRLLAELQGRANQALGDHDHLQGAHRELLAHRDHVQHLLHLSNQALEESRGQVAQLTAQLAAGARREQDLLAQVAGLDEKVAQLEGKILQLEDRGRDLTRQIDALNQTALTRLERINQLDAELRAMKASRSWRWTKPIRAIERFFGRK